MEEKEEITINNEQSVTDIDIITNNAICETNTNLNKSIEFTPCSCAEAIDKFIVTTTVQNDSFKIKGSFFEKKTIHINYYGKLLEKKDNNQIILEGFNDNTHKKSIYMYYCFDNKWDNKKVVQMDTCKKSQNQSYCSNIYLPSKSVLYIAFADDFGNWDTDSNSTYAFKVYPNKEEEIIKRYKLDNASPCKKETSSLTIYGQSFNRYFKNIVWKLKKMLKNTIFGNDY